MAGLLLRWLLTATIVVLVTEVAKRSDRLGGLIAALPLVTILTLIWLHVDRQPVEKVANHALYTFWYVLPTLPMFLLFPWLLPRLGFWPALLAGALLTGLAILALAVLVRPLGIRLLP